MQYNLFYRNHNQRAHTLTAAQKGRIFISYRRMDTRLYAHVIHAELLNFFKDDQIIFDIATLRFGQDFSERIIEAVQSSDVVLVLIGKEWLKTREDNSNRLRIDDPNDWVRTEIRIALQHNKLVIPILVDGASMPSQGELPQDIQRLANIQAFTLSKNTTTHHKEIEWLAEVIQKNLRKTNFVRDTLPKRKSWQSYIYSFLGITSKAPERNSLTPTAISQLEKTDREAAQKTVKEKAEREAAEKAVKEKEEREAVEKAAKEKAEREAIEKAKKEKEEREAVGKTKNEKELKKKTKHIFISYSRRNDAVMQRVVAFLRGQDIKVWVDNEKLVPGTPIWEIEIEQAIREAGAIVVLLSPTSNNSVWVRREISFAERYSKRIFPLLVSGDEFTSVMLRLATNQYVDIRDNEEEKGLDSLTAELKIYLEDLVRQEEDRKITEEKANR